MSAIARTLERTETLEPLDRPAGAVQRLLRKVFPDRPGIDRVLGGSWIGHPVHPILVLAPIGTWLSASLLDTVPGQQAAARRLVLSGLVTSAPAAITGAVDFRRLSAGPRRRVGLLHLLLNVTASACYVASYRARSRGDHGTGRALGLLGLATVGVSGTLGGHLTYALGVGVHRWQPERQAVPAGAPEEAEAPSRPYAGQRPAAAERATWP